MDENDVLALLSAAKRVLKRMVTVLEAGLTPSVAYELAFKELDAEYRKLCRKEGVQPVNHFLEAPSVEMFARFGLDSLFGALAGSPDQSEARKAFWATFHRATRPALDTVGRAARGSPRS